MNLRKLSKLIAVNLIILICGLVALEIHFGGWFDPRVLDRMEIPRAQVLSISVKHLYPHPTGNITYTRDHFGLRGEFLTPHGIDLLALLRHAAPTADILTWMW